MDPFLDATQILVSAAEAVVTLRGFVISEEQKAMAEHDAWYTWGVDGVINDIQTMPEMGVLGPRHAS
jgi:osmotically-inducible protein OsmY